MTHDDISGAIRDALGLPAVPDGALALLERRSDADPHDRRAARAILAVHQVETAADGLPPVVAGVRRGALLRCDGFSATFAGIRDEGRQVHVRVLRAPFQTDPVLRRALLRDGRALRDIPGSTVEIHEGTPALVASVPEFSAIGDSAAGDDARPEALVRLLGTGLSALAACEAAGVSLPALSSSEWTIGEGGLRIRCLTPGEARPREQIARLSAHLSAWWAGPPTPVDDLLVGLREHPPEAAEDALDLLRDAMVEHLSGRRHDLWQRGARSRHQERRLRLTDAVLRLADAVAPPQGRGVVGVDLEGRPTLLVGREGRLAWGIAGEEAEDVLGPEGLSPRGSRRLLRARAAAPDNPRLQAEAGGSGAFVDAACRWVAASLQLRTIRLILESREPPA